MAYIQKENVVIKGLSACVPERLKFHKAFYKELVRGRTDYENHIQKYFK